MADFDWLGNLFSQDTLNTIMNGMNTAGSIFNAAAPLINAGSQLGFGIEGTRNAAALREASKGALTQLDQLFTPESPYAKEARRQMERKDAAAGRRSQYGTRETELAANLAKQRSSVLTSPAYQALLVGANRSDYAPIAGAIGSLTGGQQQGQRGGRSSMNTPPGMSEAGQYLANLFGPGAEMAVAQGIGGASSALGGSGMMGGAGAVDSLGSMLGTGSFLPGYTNTATGIFGGATPGASQGGLAGAAGEPLAGGELASGIGAGLDLLGGAGAFGGAGTALSGMGAGSLAGTVGGADALGALAGGTGFLPSYGAAGGATASGMFGGGAAAGGAGAGAGGASAAGAAVPAGLPAAAALPFIIAALGMTGMFDDDIERPDIVDWQSRANPMNDISMGYGEFTPLANEDYNTYLNRVRGVSDYGTSKWDPASEPYVQQYYNRMQQDVFQPAAQGQSLGGWADYYASNTGE